MLIGVGAAFGLLSFVDLAIVPIVLVVGIAASRTSLRGSWVGVFAGLGATFLFIGFVQRLGPGTVCWHTATSSGCDEYLNPLPWLAMGLTLVVVSVIVNVLRRRPKIDASPS